MSKLCPIHHQPKNTLTDLNGSDIIIQMCPECVEEIGETKFIFLPTLAVIDYGLLPDSDWVSVTQRDGWYIPEETYMRLIGRTQ